MGWRGAERGQCQEPHPLRAGRAVLLDSRPEHNARGTLSPRCRLPQSPGCDGRVAPGSPVLREEQTLVFGRGVESDQRSAHIASRLAPPPLTGTLPASRPAVSLQSPVGGREAARGSQRPSGVARPQEGPCPPPPPRPQPCSPPVCKSFTLMSLLLQSLLPQVDESRTESAEACVLSTWHICRMNEWI